MAGFIQGKNCIFKVNVLGDYLTLICAKSFNLTIVADTVETTTQGTGPWKTFDYDSLSYTLSFDGAAKAIDATGPLVWDLITAQTGFVELGFQALYIDDDNVIQQITGTVIVTQTVLNAIANDVLGSTIEFQGTGEFTLQRFNNPKNLRIIVTGTANGTAKFRLINTDNDVVYDSGTLNNATDITVQVDSGSYYYYMEADSDANDNDFDVNTPPPIHVDFNASPTTNTSYPATLYDFTTDRTVIFTLGIATTLNWSYDKNISAGEFNIYKNGVNILFRNSDDSGAITVSGGDSIRVTLTTAVGSATKTVTIVDTTTSTIIFSQSGSSAVDTTFITVSGHIYSITATSA